MSNNTLNSNWTLHDFQRRGASWGTHYEEETRQKSCLFSLIFLCGWRKIHWYPNGIECSNAAWVLRGNISIRCCMVAILICKSYLQILKTEAMVGTDTIIVLRQKSRWQKSKIWYCFLHLVLGQSKILCMKSTLSIMCDTKAVKMLCAFDTDTQENI